MEEVGGHKAGRRTAQLPVHGQGSDQGRPFGLCAHHKWARSEPLAMPHLYP